MQTSVLPLADADLAEFRLTIHARDVSVLCTRSLVTWLEEQHYLGSEDAKQYGLILWPASIALALEIGQRHEAFSGRRVIELGAGVGLPGIAAASLGAKVSQTDRDEVAIELCRLNARRNGVDIEHSILDWQAWPDGLHADWLIGSDILYRRSLHDRLRSIFARCTGRGGRVMISDPMRPASLQLLQQMESDGWGVRMTKWTIGEGDEARVVGTFELSR